MTTTERTIKERPLLMRGELVRATLEGRKSQTRRPMRRQPATQLYPGEIPNTGQRVWFESDDAYNFVCPHGQIGDHIWIKESFWQYGVYTQSQSKTGRPSRRFIAHDPKPHASILFNCPGPAADRSHLGYHKRPSLFMERWMSRLTLEITDVRAQQIQDISFEDVCAEGVFNLEWTRVDDNWRKRFRALWDRINAKRGYSWESNCWVWAIKYKKGTEHVENSDCA